MNFSFSELTKRPVVLMAVYNDFSNDARVLKETLTLEKDGKNVVVIAFQGEGLPDRESLTPHIHVWRIFRSIPLLSRPYKFLCFDLIYPMLRRFNANLGKIAHFLFKIPEYVFIILRTIWLLLRLPCQVIHSHDLNSLPACWIAAKCRRKPIVYDAHEISFDREGYAQFKYILKPLERTLIRRVDRVITTTNMRAELLASTYGITTPAVLQNRPFLQDIVVTTSLRERLSLNASWPIILYQGGISSGRGMRHLVKVAERMPDTYFVCIGSGKQADELDRLIVKAELQTRFFRLPKVPLAELHPLTCSATIGIQPLRNTCLNHYTTDSNKLFEYVMAGLPVAASRFPEIEKIVTEFEVGVLFDPDNLDEITEQLKHLLESEVLARYRQNVLRAREQLNWESQEHVLIHDVYSGLLQSHLSD